jgi:hypothetical protein
MPKILPQPALLDKPAVAPGDRLVQAVGAYRLQRFLGIRLNPAQKGDLGIDYIATSGKKIQLKGPFLQKGTLEPLNKDINRIIADIKRGISGNKAAQIFYIDTLGLTDAQAVQMRNAIGEQGGRVIFLR